MSNQQCQILSQHFRVVSAYVLYIYSSRLISSTVELILLHTRYLYPIETRLIEERQSWVNSNAANSHNSFLQTTASLTDTFAGVSVLSERYVSSGNLRIQSLVFLLTDFTANTVRYGEHDTVYEVNARHTQLCRGHLHLPEMHLYVAVISKMVKTDAE